MTDDARIEKEIVARLTRDTRVNLNQSELRVKSEGGYVDLSGEVDSVAALRLAAIHAGQVDGVRKVRENLLVKAPQAMGDLELARHIENAITQEPNLDEKEIEVQADSEGRVTITGSVHSWIALRLAEVLAWWVPGTRHVRNALVIEPHEQDSDEELKDNLVVILGKDPLVDPSNFHIIVVDREITLRGQAPTPVEKDAALRDCWYTPGVRGVIDELSVRSVTPESHEQGKKGAK